MTLPPNDDALESLFAKLDSLTKQKNLLTEITKYFPTASTARIAAAIAKILEALWKVPPKGWEAIALFLQCKNEKLAELGLDELKQLLYMMKGFIDTQLENESDPAIKDKLKKAQEDLDTQMSTLLRQTDVNELRRMIKKIKDDHLSVVLAIGALFGTNEIRKVLEKAKDLPPTVPKKMIGKFIKNLLEKVIIKVLAKKVAKETAKKLIPYVGVMLTLAEAIALALITDQITDLDKAICEIRCQITDALVGAGWGWPHHKYIYFNKDFIKPGKWYVVKVVGWVWCHKKGQQTEDGEVLSECVWGSKCFVQFDNADLQIVADVPHNVLGKADDANPQQFRIPFEVSSATLDNTYCVGEADKCLFLTEVKIYEINSDKFKPGSGIDMKKAVSTAKQISRQFHIAGAKTFP